MSDRSRLKELLLQLSYEQKEVRLASGRTSNFYFDGKQTALHPEGAYLIGKAMFDLIAVRYPQVQAVGGPTLGADPLVSAVSLTSHLQKKPLPAFIIRKEPKKHGTEAWIEGDKSLKPGMRVALLEDVITTGGSVLKAAEKAKAAGLQVELILVIVDREEGGREALMQQGFAVESLFRKSELIGLESE